MWSSLVEGDERLSSLVEGDEGWEAILFMANPKKMCNTCMASFYTCLTVGPIRLFIFCYLRAPWIVTSLPTCTLKNISNSLLVPLKRSVACF